MEGMKLPDWTENQLELLVELPDGSPVIDLFTEGEHVYAMTVEGFYKISVDGTYERLSGIAAHSLPPSPPGLPLRRIRTGFYGSRDGRRSSFLRRRRSRCSRWATCWSLPAATQ